LEENNHLKHEIWSNEIKIMLKTRKSADAGANNEMQKFKIRNFTSPWLKPRNFGLIEKIVQIIRFSDEQNMLYCMNVEVKGRLRHEMLFYETSFEKRFWRRRRGTCDLQRTFFTTSFQVDFCPSSRSRWSLVMILAPFNSPYLELFNGV
jgi:hypothetical protein